MRKTDYLGAQVAEWSKTTSLTVDEVLRDVIRLVRQEEFQAGYRKAEKDREREKIRQLAVFRNGGTEPEYTQCHFCGEYVANGFSSDGDRHWLSDCRPDLVKHEPGPICTWHGLTDKDGKPIGEYDCYAYKDTDTNKWGAEHKHFYEDGPMG